MRYRTERKTLISAGAATLVKRRLSGLLPLDEHAGGDGAYRVTSLYFDDFYMRAYHQKLAGAFSRVKFRARVYNGGVGDADLSPVLLEAKIKHGGMCSKEAARLSPEEFARIADGDCDCLSARRERVCVEFLKEARLRLLKPVVAVDYTRTAYVCPLGNVRITVDEGLRACSPQYNMLSEASAWRNVFPRGEAVLEVKYDAFLPSYIAEALGGLAATASAVSKYVLCLDTLRLN